MHPTRIALLHSFVAFNDSKNITEAAKVLGITQPALSKQLKELESSLEIPIFTRLGRRKVLTPFGRTLHERLKERLGNIQDAITTEQNRYRSARYARINIAGRTGILDRISDKLPFEGSLFFLEFSNDQIIESLRNLKAEVGITHIAPDSLDLIAKPLFKEEFQLVIPKRFYRTKPTLSAELFSYIQTAPCLGYKPDDEIIFAVTSFYSTSNQGAWMFRATENYNSIKNMVEAEMGWSIIPSYLQVSSKNTWSVPVPSKALLARQFYLIYRKEFASVPWFKELLSKIHLCFKE